MERLRELSVRVEGFILASVHSERAGVWEGGEAQQGECEAACSCLGWSGSGEMNAGTHSSFVVFCFPWSALSAHRMGPPSSGWNFPSQVIFSGHSISGMPQSVLKDVFPNTSWQLQLPLTASYYNLGLGLYVLLSINQGQGREDIWLWVSLSEDFLSAFLSFLISRNPQPRCTGGLTLSYCSSHSNGDYQSRLP